MFRPLLAISGFYNIEEEAINAVKTVWGLLIYRSLDQPPDHYVPSARAICKHGEKIYKQRKNPLAGVEMGGNLLGAA